MMTYKKLLFVIYSMLPFMLMAQMETSNNLKKPYSNGLGAVDYDFQVGTQAGFSSGNASFLNTYFSPSAKFDVTKKFSIVAGVGTSFTQLNNYTMLNQEGNLTKTDAKITSIYSYASGIYKVSPKVNVNAGVFVEQVFTNMPGNEPALNNQYKDITLGINYNVTRHISFNAQIQFSDRPNQYYNSYQRSSGNQGFQGFQGGSVFPPFY
jgi:hypothetical protein